MSVDLGQSQGSVKQHHFLLESLVQVDLEEVVFLPVVIVSVISLDSTCPRI